MEDEANEHVSNTNIENDENIAKDVTNEDGDDNMNIENDENIVEDVTNEDGDGNMNIENIAEDGVTENAVDLTNEDGDGNMDIENIAEDGVTENAVDLTNDDDDHEIADDSVAEDICKAQLPLFKIRKIIKADEDNELIITKEATFLASVAAELFIASVAQQTVKITQANKKKTIQLTHLKSALAGSQDFDFLEGCFPDIY